MIQKKTIVYKQKKTDSDFIYGYPYSAEMFGNSLRIQDEEFQGNIYRTYDSNLFYVQDATFVNIKDDDVAYRRCITVRYLCSYKDTVLLRGCYYKCGTGQVDNDSECLYLRKHGLSLYYVENGCYGFDFNTDEEAIIVFKKAIDNCINFDNLNELGEASLYIMNINQVLEGI